MDVARARPAPAGGAEAKSAAHVFADRHDKLVVFSTAQCPEATFLQSFQEGVLGFPQCPARGAFQFDGQADVGAALVQQDQIRLTLRVALPPTVDALPGSVLHLAQARDHDGFRIPRADEIDDLVVQVLLRLQVDNLSSNRLRLLHGTGSFFYCYDVLRHASKKNIGALSCRIQAGVSSLPMAVRSVRSLSVSQSSWAMVARSFVSSSLRRLRMLICVSE